MELTHHERRRRETDQVVHAAAVRHMTERIAASSRRIVMPSEPISESDRQARRAKLADLLARHGVTE